MASLSRPAGSLLRFALLASCSSLLLSACVEKGGGTHEAHTGPARLQIVGGDTVNWGKIAPGSLKDTIVLVNTGGDTLRIKDVHASCGCTTAPIDRKNLGPGDTAQIAVTLDALHRNGPQHKTLTITSNDSSRATAMIHLIADIQRDIAVTPDIFPIVLVKSVGAEGTSTVTLRNNGTAPVTIEPPALMPQQGILVSFDMNSPRTLAPNDTLAITARVKVLKAEGGTANFSMTTSSKLVPKIELSVTGQLDRSVPMPKTQEPTPGKSIGRK